MTPVSSVVNMLEFISISCGSNCNQALCVIGKNKDYCRPGNYKLLMKMTKSRGHSTLPCGTPDSTL